VPGPTSQTHRFPPFGGWASRFRARQFSGQAVQLVSRLAEGPACQPNLRYGTPGSPSFGRWRGIANSRRSTYDLSRVFPSGNLGTGRSPVRRSGAVLVAGAGLTGALGGCLMVRALAPAPIAKPRLLDQVRQAIRARHYSPRTEKATQFLSNLATRGKVSTSTQNQALSAPLFLYKDVLGRELDWLEPRSSGRSGPSGSRWCCPEKRSWPPGGGSSRQPGSTWIARPGSAAAITSTSPCSSGPRTIYTHVLNRGGRGVRSPPGLSIPAPWRALLQPLSCYTARLRSVSRRRALAGGRNRAMQKEIRDTSECRETGYTAKLAAFIRLSRAG
jgi:hypothetical protein